LAVAEYDADQTAARPAGNQCAAKGLANMMISEAMNTKLNEQIAVEFDAAHQYLAMACSFESMGYRILAKWFYKQSEEERTHAKRIIDYVHSVDGCVALTAVSAPKSEFKSVEEIIKMALEGEERITTMINELATLAGNEQDHATQSMLAWFVDEQVEEVASMRGVLQLVELANGNILQVENRLRHEMLAAPA